MSVYDREWYRRESERKQHRQEGIDAMWNEVEKPHQTKNRTGRKAGRPRQRLRRR